MPTLNQDGLEIVQPAQAPDLNEDGLPIVTRVRATPATNEDGFPILARSRPPSSLDGAPAPEIASLLSQPADTQASLIRQRMEGRAPTEIGPQVDRGAPQSLEEAARQVGEPMQGKEERRVQWIKDQLNEGDKSTEDFVSDHPEMKYAVHGFMSPTDMPMQRLSRPQADLLFGKTVGGVVAGAQNAIADFVDFATSAPGVMTAMSGGVATGAAGAGLPGIEAAIHRSIANAFATDMATKMPDQFEGVMDAIRRGDQAEATRQILGAAASLAIIGGAGKGNIGPKAGLDTRGGPPGAPAPGSPPVEPPRAAPVVPTPGLAAELEATMRGNQLAPKDATTTGSVLSENAPADPGLAPQPVVEPRNKVHAAVQEMIEAGKRATAAAEQLENSAGLSDRAGGGTAERLASGQNEEAPAARQALLEQEGLSKATAAKVDRGELTPAQAVDETLPQLVAPRGEEGHDEAYARAREEGLARIQEIMQPFEFAHTWPAMPELNMPAMDHFTMTHDVPEHGLVKGSTVSRRTLEKAGFTVPEAPKDLTPEPQAETIKPVAPEPETNTVRTAASSGLNDERIGSAMTAERGAIPPRPAAAITNDLRNARATAKDLSERIVKFQALGDSQKAAALDERRGQVQRQIADLEQELRDKNALLAKERRANPRPPNAAERDRPPDLIDHVLEHTQLISLQSARAIQEDFRPFGAARKLFTTRGGMAMDKILDELRRARRLGENATEGDLLDGINGAARARKDWRAGRSKEARQLSEEERQHVDFQGAIKTPTQGTEPVIADDLNEGDKFTLHGAKFVTRLEFDRDGQVTGIELDDGQKYGTQLVNGETRLRIDKDSLKRAGEGASALPTGETAELPPPTDQPAPVAARPEPIVRKVSAEKAAEPEKPLFGAPESVEEQKAREAQEAAQRKAAAQKQAIEDRAAKPLVGSVGDLGQANFVKGDDDLFSAGKKPSTEKSAEGLALPDKIETWLNKAIEATDFKRDSLLEGVGRAPVWVTKALANGALRVVRAAYQAGGRLAEAIEAGVHWLREQKPDGFNEDEARKWVTDLSRNANPVIQRAPIEVAPRVEELYNRRAEITTRLNELNKQAGRSGGLSKADKGERYALAKEANQIRKTLAKDPEHVADLLRKAEQLGNEMQQAKAAGNGLRARELGDELHGIMEGDLAAVDPKLMLKTYNDLVARGEIMGSGLHELPEGRTMGELTRWLKASNIDSPKLTLRERFSLARRLSEEFSKGKDMIERAANRITAAWDAFKAQYKAPPIDTEFRDLVKHWIFEKQWTGLETHNWVQAIRKAVPQVTRRMAISIYMDAGGDMDLLRSQAGLVPERFRRVWETALTLTDSEKSLARRIELDFEQKLEDGMNAGVLKKGRQDYGVPQQWSKAPESDQDYDPTEPSKRPGRARNPRAKLDPGDPFFALERTHASYFDGIMAKGIPRSLDIGDLVGLYNWDFHGVLADRGFIKTLKDARAPGIDEEHGAGDPLVVISGAARIEPRDAGARTYFVDSTWKPKEAVTADGRPYVAVNHWALKDWKFASVDADGNPIIVHGDFLVHPDYARFVKNELSKSALRDLEGPLAGVTPYTRAVLNSAAFLKASKFASATFHLATIAEHTAFHLVMPLTKGVDLDFVRNPTLARLVREGGLELGFGQPQELFDDGLSSHGGLWQKVPGLGEGLRQMSDWLFKDYIPKIKAKVALVVLDRNTRRYARELNQQQILELTGRQMNAAFGMQNWRLMGSNKTMLDVNRLLLTAPDFLLSRAKVVAQAFKPYGREQRYFLLGQAAFVYMAARSLNYLFNRDPHWEPENALSVIYAGRAYSARFIVNDLFNLAKDVGSSANGVGMGFVAGRLGPFPRAGIEAVTGRDLRTGVRKDVPFPTDIKALRAAQIVAKDLAEWFIPMGVESLLPESMTGKAAGGDSKLSELGLALVGVGSHKYTAQTQMYQMASSYNRASPETQAQHFQARRDAEAHAASAYVKLDNLIDAGEMDRARKEYDALLEEGYKADSIERHYEHAQYFTGSAARERAFIQTLSAGQKQTYAQAQADRTARAAKFRTMQRSQFARVPD